MIATWLKTSVGTPTNHHISSYSIPFHLIALLPLSVPKSTHTDLVNGSLTTTANHSLTPSFSVYFYEQRKRPPTSVLHPTSHAYLLCQLANGRADGTAGDRNKRSPFRPTRFMIRLKNRLRREWQLPGSPLWKLRSTACRGRSVGSTSGETTSGALHSNPSILKTSRCGVWPSRWWEFLLRHPPLITIGGISLWDSEKAEALSDNLETQFQPVTDPSVSAAIETVNVALRSYFLSPASEPQLTTPDEVHEAIRGLKVNMAPVRTVYRTGHWSIFPSERFPFSPVSSTPFSAPIISLKRGNMLEWSLSLNRGRIHHCPLPIGPLVSWTRLVNYLKKSY